MQKRERFKIPVAVFLVLRKDDEILLIKRATTGWKDGYYSLPAGCLEVDEDVRTAAVREAEEETGVKVDIQNVELAHTQHCLIGEQNWINLYFTTTQWEGEPMVCEPEKHSEVRWVSYTDLPEMMVEYVEEAIVNSSNKRLYSSFFRSA